jgi:hypothetical protein
MYINKLLAHTFKNVYKIPRSINFNHWLRWRTNISEKLSWGWNSLFALPFF